MFWEFTDPTFKGGLQKTNIQGGAWTVSQFKGGLGKKEGVGVFDRDGVNTPIHTVLI